MKFNKIALVFAIVAVSVIMVQCKKPKPVTTVEVVDPLAASFSNMQQHIFKHSCNTSGCHNTAAATNVQHGLVLEGVDVYERLINIGPKNVDAKAAGLKLVKPGVADSSFLFTKCAWKTFKYGNYMPLGADTLDADEVEYIKQWINAGAPKTGVVADASLLKPH